MFLPPYSPDHNPIKQAIAKLTSHLRKAGARTQAALSSAIAGALDSFPPQQCANFLADAGYGQSA